MSNKNLKKQEASEKLKYDSYRFMHFVAIKINFLLHFLVKKRLHVSLMPYLSPTFYSIGEELDQNKAYSVKQKFEETRSFGKIKI